MNINIVTMYPHKKLEEFRRLFSRFWLDNLSKKETTRVRSRMYGLFFELVYDARASEKAFKIMKAVYRKVEKQEALLKK